MVSLFPPVLTERVQGQTRLISQGPSVQSIPCQSCSIGGCRQAISLQGSWFGGGEYHYYYYCYTSMCMFMKDNHHSHLALCVCISLHDYNSLDRHWLLRSKLRSPRLLLWVCLRAQVSTIVCTTTLYSLLLDEPDGVIRYQRSDLPICLL